MTILITQNEPLGDYGSFIAATVGKVSGYASFSRHGVQVCCTSAPRPSYRLPMGKCFDTPAEALQHYKSPEMRTIIETAAQLNQERLNKNRGQLA